MRHYYEEKGVKILEIGEDKGRVKRMMDGFRYGKKCDMRDPGYAMQIC